MMIVKSFFLLLCLGYGLMVWAKRSSSLRYLQRDLPSTARWALNESLLYSVLMGVAIGFFFHILLW